MSPLRRATIYFEPELHRRLRLEAAASERTISELTGEAVEAYLAGLEADRALFAARGGEPNLPLEAVLKELERRGV